MIRKVIKKRELTDSSTGEDLSFWRSRPPSERLAAVEILRRRYHVIPLSAGEAATVTLRLLDDTGAPLAVAR